MITCRERDERKPQNGEEKSKKQWEGIHICTGEERT